MTIMSERCMFMAFHTLKMVREAIIIAAAKEGISWSAWIHNAVVEKLVEMKLLDKDIVDMVSGTQEDQEQHSWS